MCRNFVPCDLMLCRQDWYTSISSRTTHAHVFVMAAVSYTIWCVPTIEYRRLWTSTAHLIQPDSPTALSIVRAAVNLQCAGVAELSAHHVGRVQVFIEHIIAHGSPGAADVNFKPAVVAVGEVHSCRERQNPVRDQQRNPTQWLNALSCLTQLLVLIAKSCNWMMGLYIRRPVFNSQWYELDFFGPSFHACILEERV